MAGILFVIGAEVNASSKDSDLKWTESFNLDKCNFISTGSNTYFILKPGYQTVFAGVDEGVDTETYDNVRKKVLNKANRYYVVVRYGVQYSARRTRNAC